MPEALAAIVRTHRTAICTAHGLQMQQNGSQAAGSESSLPLETVLETLLTYWEQGEAAAAHTWAQRQVQVATHARLAPADVMRQLDFLSNVIRLYIDTKGRVGVLDAYCPHRGAPLFFGRNEECGLRCVYHGWQFDVHGMCTDIPNVPEGDTYKSKVRTTSYPTLEQAGLIWVYMGPTDKQPPFYQFDWLDTSDSHRFIQKLIINCNYFQSMEGDFDASHAPFLHRTLDNNASNLSARIRENMTTYEDVTPTYVLEDTAYGNIFGAVRQQKDGNTFVGVTHWIMPCFTTPGASPKVLQMNMRVPVDDTHTMHYRLRYDLHDPLSERELWENKHGGFLFPEVIPGTFTPAANKSNDYLIDRLMQRNYSYTGIKSFPIQDLAMIEDQWGPIANRWLEHLVSSDEAIIRVRRNILKAARDLSQGIEPALAQTPEVSRVFPARMVLPADADVAEALKPHMSPMPPPPGL